MFSAGSESKNNAILKIGLTGGIGSGKSTAANFFSALSVPVIDADLIARKVINSVIVFPKIIEHFGEKIRNEQGGLNRSLLRTIIFENAAERRWLEDLLHPLIVREIQQQLADLRGSPYCVIVIPLLLEATQPYEIVNRILVIDIPESLQIKRTQNRDHIPLPLIQKMLASQLSREQRRRKADDVINNDGDLSNLQQQVQQIHKYYLTLTQAGNPPQSN